MALAAFLDSLDVEHHWLRSNERIDWETGDPNPSANGEMLQKDETHCSSFVAEAAKRLGVYILRPPQHSTVLLANAQFDWLNSEAAAQQGWARVPTAIEAQQAANQGDLVVAVFRNPKSQAPGHIAIVRPSDKPPEKILEEGPQEIQAGFENYDSIDLKTGFSHHPGAWIAGGQGAVEFFKHDVGRIP